MEQFSNGTLSHQHSLQTLEAINQYEEFMESITTIADFGCGTGHDIDWWSRLEYIDYTYDEEGNVVAETVRQRNYKCYAVDRDIKSMGVELKDSVHVVEGDIEQRRLLSTPVDVVWCHDTFQYFVNPLNTLKLINEQMVENGMLYIGFPMQSAHIDNRWVCRGHHRQYFNHNFLSLIYMLAVNGFDCRDAYFSKKLGDPWIHAAVYKTKYKPMDPTVTTWQDLAELNLLNDSMKNSLSKHGYIRQEDLVCVWLDRSRHLIQD
jgi:SAM-dependent methyltransferase